MQESSKTIGQYLSLQAIRSFGISFISATYTTFLLARGLDLFQVNLVNFVFFATLFVCEIPTGAFADVFGRKLSFVLSCFLLAAGMFIYALSDSFWGFALAEVTAAVGSTFANGAFQAWLADRLKQLGYNKPLDYVFAKDVQVRSLSGIIAAILGAFLSDQNLALPWFIGGMIMASGGILALVCMKDERFIRQRFNPVKGLHSMLETITTGAKYSQKSKAVRFVLMSGLVQFFAVQAPNMQWQPFFGQFLPNRTSYGFVFAGIAGFMALGAVLAPSIAARINNPRLSLLLAQAVIGVGISLTVICTNLPAALTVFLVHEAARGIFVPIKDAYLNANIPSKERATLISFDSLSHHLGGMAGLLVSGALAKHLSLPTAWVISGGILVVSALWMLRNGHHDR